MQKCAVLPGKMQKSGAELGKTNVHVEAERSTKIVMVKTHKALKSRAFSYATFYLDTFLHTFSEGI